MKTTSGVTKTPDPLDPFGGNAMARNDVRPVVTLRSTAGTGYSYVTRKNRRTNGDRLVLRKFDPRLGAHAEFREER